MNAIFSLSLQKVDFFVCLATVFGKFFRALTNRYFEHVWLIIEFFQSKTSIWFDFGTPQASNGIFCISLLTIYQFIGPLDIIIWTHTMEKFIEPLSKGNL